MTLAGLFYISSFFLGVLGAWVVSSSALKLGLLDHPNKRSSHSNPTPKCGGIGILVVTICGALWWHIPLSLWIPACIVSLVSLLGDFRDVSFKIRLSIQVGLAAIVSGSIFMRGFLSDMPLGFIILLFIFGILFITATANYYNFMDGINGLAGLTGVIAFLCLGIFGLLQVKDVPWIPAAFGVAAACLGFLPLNFPRAKVFMGDVGSVLLGFLFASFVLWYARSLLEFVVLSSFLFPFYIDELNTQLARIKEKERLTDAHRRHIYQILVNQAGLSHGMVTVVYGFIQIIVAILTWSVMREGFLAEMSLLMVLSGISLFTGMQIRHRWEDKKDLRFNGVRLI